LGSNLIGAGMIRLNVKFSTLTLCRIGKFRHLKLQRIQLGAWTMPDDADPVAAFRKKRENLMRKGQEQHGTKEKQMKNKETK